MHGCSAGPGSLWWLPSKTSTDGVSPAEFVELFPGITDQRARRVWERFARSTTAAVAKRGFLFDQGTPVPLPRLLTDQVVATGYELGLGFRDPYGDAGELSIIGPLVCQAGNPSVSIKANQTHANAIMNVWYRQWCRKAVPSWGPGTGWGWQGHGKDGLRGVQPPAGRRGAQHHDGMQRSHWEDDIGIALVVHTIDR